MKWIYLDVGMALKMWRLRRRRKQNSVADSIGLAQGYLSLVESGQRNPTIETVLKLCDELQVPPSDVFKEAERSLEEDWGQGSE